MVTSVHYTMYLLRVAPAKSETMDLVRAWIKGKKEKCINIVRRANVPT